MNQNSPHQTAADTAQMKQTTTSMLLVFNTQILLIPSKAKHRMKNQFDPPSCSTCFNSEKERVEYIFELLKQEKYPKKEFGRNFHLIHTPIKFFHKDYLCGKLFTGYLVLLKSKSIIKNFLIDREERWLEMSAVIDEQEPVYVSPLFTKAVKALKSEMSVFLSIRERFF